MTNEVAVKELRALLNMCEPSPFAKELEDALKMAIKALEQQSYDEDFIHHKKEVLERIDKREREIDKYIKELEELACEDCISRQKALDCFEQTNTRQGAKYAIETLPSITPQRPKGEWIDICVIKSFHYDGEPRVRCSRCGNEEEWSSNYCPNCGAEMSGGGEDDGDSN